MFRRANQSGLAPTEITGASDLHPDHGSNNQLPAAPLPHDTQRTGQSWTTGRTGHRLGDSTIDTIDYNYVLSHDVIRESLKGGGTDINGETCNVTLHVYWDIVHFCREELSAVGELRQVVTVTGTPIRAEAASCEDFVESRWGQDGLKILDLLICWIQRYDRG